MPDKEKILIALSGGVDSSVSAAILREKGFRCTGVYMITCEEGKHQLGHAQKLARKLQIKLYTLDLRERFGNIFEYFCNEYRQGRTPNPCVVCNREIKFGLLRDFAQQKGFNYLATGHYARIRQANHTNGLYAAADAAKDQSYMLAMIRREALDNIILPLGDYTKDQIRRLALNYGLGTESKEESQEICFIPDDDYVTALEDFCPDLPPQGPITDSEGNLLGYHEGIYKYTIGQRRGLGIAMGRPYYVTAIDAKDNRITLGPKEEIMHRSFRATGVNWLANPPQKPFRAKVRIRYNHNPVAATVSPADADRVSAQFDEPVPAVTPGQLAVFYVPEDLGERVYGGAWIVEAEK